MASSSNFLIFERSTDLGQETEEDDYMSDNLLAQVPDIRPGILSSSTARKFRIEEEQRMANQRNKKSQYQSLKELEKANREEALSTPLSTDSKGFALMSKMGYKPGMSLGKKDEGIKEPIVVDLKGDRTGLGHDTEQKRKSEARARAHFHAAEKRQKLDQQLIGDYRLKKRELATLKQTEYDLHKSQKACRDLDQRVGLQFPSRDFFWPDYEPDEAELSFYEEQNERDRPEDLEDPGYRLRLITAYLRIKHIYCVWCGTHYEDKEDLTSHCPGDTKAAHDQDDEM